MIHNKINTSTFYKLLFLFTLIFTTFQGESWIVNNTIAQTSSTIDIIEPPGSKPMSINEKVNWMLAVITILSCIVLGYAFDISKYTSKITGKEGLKWNKINAILTLAFLVIGLAAFWWEMVYHGKHIMLGNASSEHGVTIDSMFSITLFFTTVVFIITQILLFYFLYKYYYNPNRKATYYAHNNKLELIWTMVPAIVLTVLVLRGYSTWKDITYDKDEKVQEIEVFGYQFGWYARYPGADNKLGAGSYNYISGTNPLGLPVKDEVEKLKLELKNQIEQLSADTATFHKIERELCSAKRNNDKLAIAQLTSQLNEFYIDDKITEAKLALRRKSKQLKRMDAIENEPKMYSTVFNNSSNDDIIEKEIHLVVNKPVEFKFRARDVIHSAYQPHMRLQMNVVPGMPTKFRFKPTKTTAQIRNEKKDKEYDYYLYCAKICGSSHYNMRIKVVVETQEEYNKWLSERKPAFAKPLPVAEESKNTEKKDTIKDNKLTKVVAIR